MKKFNIRKRCGFTLAEVLITLGIIGVIAAITIPALMNRTQNREIVVAFKKEYSELSQAVLRLQMENGGMIAGGIGSNAAGLITTLQNYMNFSKVCSTNSYTEGCAGYVGLNAANLKMLNGNNYIWPSMFTIPGAVMQNGAIIVSFNFDANCNGSGADVGICATITIDVNGSKPPNIFGRDILRIYLTSIGLIPAGSHGDEAVTTPATYGCRDSGTVDNSIVEGCAARILREDAMNY